jgi:gamma-glutamyltranspeptidase / glutathione hydrolase
MSKKRKTISSAMLTFAISGALSDAQDRTLGRSMVISRHGIVATESPLASQAGAMVLAHGGNAVDAAIAANAMMGVVSPMMNGIGGDLFVIVYDAKTGEYHGLNASGWSPAKMTIEHFKELGLKAMPHQGINTITIPGAVDGWDKLLRRFGRKKLPELLAPAIQCAEEGFPVTEWVSGYWLESEKLLQKDPNAARTYLPGGRAPRVGEIFRNPDLAWSYRQIAAHGRKAFYSGAIAQRLLAYLKKMGGVMEAADLAEFSSEWVDPWSTTYRDWTVHEMPPNGQGVAALGMLKIMEQFPMGKFGANSADALHVMIEAKKLAYADMFLNVADPKFADQFLPGENTLDLHDMLTDEYGRREANQIDMKHAHCPGVPGARPPAGSDTTYLCVVDSEGNMVSYIQSNYSAFGSGLVADGTGFALQNRGGLFSLNPGSPNVLAGRKRPLHTIIPAFMNKGGARIAFGIMGGWNQSQAHAQFISNVADHGMNIQAAVEAPRFTKLTFAGCDVEIESRVPESVRAELEARGHQLKVLGSFADPMGGGQAVMRDFAAGVNYGASDPRKDGAAIPEPWPHK